MILIQSSKFIVSINTHLTVNFSYLLVSNNPSDPMLFSSRYLVPLYEFWLDWSYHLKTANHHYDDF
jgi:hypothetical protein